MPRARTKAARAAELLRKLRAGPSFSPMQIPDPVARDRAIAAYHLWASTWITPEVIALIPQLKDAAK